MDLVINTSNILKSLEENLTSDVRTAKMLIKRMGIANADPRLAQTGWVGLYADALSLGPHTLGSGSRNWDTTHTFRVIVQAVHRADPAQAHERLEAYVKDVLDVVLEDKTLKASVDTLDGIQITYQFFEEDRDSMHFEGALISLQFSGRTR